jgi:hypothetical protein
MADDGKHSRATLTFDRGQLAELAAATREEESFADLAADDDAAADDAADWAVEPVPQVAQGSEPTPRPAYSRADTISDPLTMALLAEVARNSQTVEFDPAQIAQAMRGPQPADDTTPGAPPAEPPHPHVKRRA